MSDGLVTVGALTRLGLRLTPAGGLVVKGALKTNSTGSAAGIGYDTGAGGTVTQATSRTTGVTLNKLTGQITTNNASLAAQASAEFTVTDSALMATDTVVLSIQSGSNGGNTNAYVSAVANGSFNIRVANNNPSAGTAETGAIVINFAVLKAVTA